jgi:hypothetical protein
MVEGASCYAQWLSSAHFSVVLRGDVVGWLERKEAKGRRVPTPDNNFSQASSALWLLAPFRHQTG